MKKAALTHSLLWYALAKPLQTIIVSKGEAPTAYYTTKIENNIENHKMKQKKNDRNGS
nr:MAG TPA: hypothetical protein [Caudoviricetes sp.]